VKFTSATILIFSLCAWMFGDDDQAALPLSAAKLLESSSHVENRLERDYKSKLIDEQNKLIASLDKILKEQMKNNNVDGAIAVKKTMKKISDVIAGEKMSMEFSNYSEDDVAKLMMSIPYDLQYPGGHRILKFAERGQFLEGANAYENTWRVVGLQLEILNGAKAIFSRWNFDAETGCWNNVKDKDVVCQVDLKLIPVRQDEPNN